MFNECHIHLCDCTWLNVFSHARSLLIKLKKIFKCFSCLWKVFCFCKNVKNFKKKLCCLVLVTQSQVGPFASPHRDFSQLTSGSMPQSQKILRIFFKIWVFNVSRDLIWRLVCGWKVQLWGDSKIFTAYLTSPSQVELLVAKNTWIKFSKFLSWVFWRLAQATCSRLDLVAKITCFAQIGQFLNVFSFSLELLWLFIVFLTWNILKLTVLLSNKFPFLLHFNLVLQEKIWVFLLSYSISCVFLISMLLLSFVIYVIHVWDGFTQLGLLKGFYWF